MRLTIDEIIDLWLEVQAELVANYESADESYKWLLASPVVYTRNELLRIYANGYMVSPELQMAKKYERSA